MNESPVCFMIVSLISQQKRYKSLNYVNNCTFAGGKEYKADMTSSHDIWQWQEPGTAWKGIHSGWEETLALFFYI